MKKDQLNQLFTYINGSIYWKTPRKRINVGDKAGTTLSTGYRSVLIDGKRQMEHRVIFMMHHGFLPKELDHIDGNSLNNKIENLREATRSSNMQNTKLLTKNKSKCKNVYWHKISKKWKVQLSANKQRMFCGSFNDLELADLVAQEARDKYHKEFARHL
jgi:hypothetical protein